MSQKFLVTATAWLRGEELAHYSITFIATAKTIGDLPRGEMDQDWLGYKVMRSDISVKIFEYIKQHTTNFHEKEYFTFEYQDLSEVDIIE